MFFIRRNKTGGVTALRIVNGLDISEREKIVASKLFSQWIDKESRGALANMLPQQPLSLKEQMENGLSVVAINDIAYLGHTTAWEYQNSGWAELGSLIIHPQHRKKGLGKEIVGKAVEYFGSKFKLVATVKTEASKKAFLSNNFTIMSFSSLPEEIRFECCPCFNPPEMCPKMDISCTLLVHRGV